MRDILIDLDTAKFLSDPDPIRRAQIQMRTPLPKRFYKSVTVAQDEDGYSIRLDGRPVRTPGNTPILLPTEAAAILVAEEFEAQTEVIDPSTMPIYRLANSALDGVAANPNAVLEDILRFVSSDLICYRAETPEGLVARQNRMWDPILDWAHTTLGARFNLAAGIIHVEQPQEAAEAIGRYLAGAGGALHLAALHVMTSLTGSALIAIAIDARFVDAEVGWLAAHVDEDWQIEHWGDDSEAVARRNFRKRDMLGAVRLIEALRS